MSRTPASRYPNRSRQGGATAVEFAIVSLVFFTVLLGIMEMSRVLFYMNTASEATRLGARVAVVCDVGDTIVKTRMAGMLGLLTPDKIEVDYQPAGCSVNSCRSVTVSIREVSVDTYIPFVPFTLSMPAFSTTLPRESMSSANNPACN